MLGIIVLFSKCCPPTDCPFNKDQIKKKLIKGKIIVPANHQENLGFIATISDHQNSSLVIYKESEFPNARDGQEIYFNLFELDGIPIAENIVEKVNSIDDVSGGSVSTQIDLHKFYNHDHGTGDNIHIKLHLSNALESNGNTQWTFSNGLTLSGGENYFDEFGQMNNREFWVNYDEDDKILVDIDSCHRHGTTIYHCIENK